MQSVLEKIPKPNYPPAFSLAACRLTDYSQESQLDARTYTHIILYFIRMELRSIFWNLQYIGWKKWLPRM